jgi:hypothetical protein
MARPGRRGGPHRGTDGQREPNPATLYAELGSSLMRFAPAHVGAAWSWAPTPSPWSSGPRPHGAAETVTWAEVSARADFPVSLG